MRVFMLFAAICIILPCAAFCEEFKDVPKDNWAAEAVQKMADSGVLKGYPDDKFHGDKPVTRYELAVALERMIAYIQESQKPLVTKEEKLTLTPPLHWAKESVLFLKDGGFVAPDSSLLTDGSKTVKCDEMASALSSVALRLIEEEVPAPKE